MLMSSRRSRLYRENVYTAFFLPLAKQLGCSKSKMQKKLKRFMQRIENIFPHQRRWKAYWNQSMALNKSTLSEKASLEWVETAFFCFAYSFFSFRMSCLFSFNSFENVYVACSTHSKIVLQCNIYMQFLFCKKRVLLVVIRALFELIVMLLLSAKFKLMAHLNWWKSHSFALTTI